MSRPIHGEELATVARSPDVVWSVVDDYWRKLAGSRAVIAGASPSEALFTYGIEITPSGMTRCCDRSSLSKARSGLRDDLERLGELLEQG